MAGTIFLNNGDLRIAMSNNQWCRKMAIGTNWQSIRVGLRLAIRDGGADIGGNPVFSFGLSSGTVNFFGDSSVDHFLGILAQPSSWTRITGTGSNILYDIRGPIAGNQLSIAKRVGTTTTILNWAADFSITGPPELQRCMLIFYASKGPPFSLKAIGYNGGADAGDLSQTAFFNGVLSETLPANYVQMSYTDNTNQISEVNDGSFDSICCHCNVASPSIEISDIAAARLS